MFSKNTYLQLPQVSSSSSSLYPRPTNGTGPLVDLNGVEILLHHHHHHHHPDMFSGHHYAPPPVEAAALLNQGGTGDGDHHHHHHHHCSSSSSVQRRKAAAAATVKKDRHSKIFTSQGPRDRRVRLSIGIARKFFDLQEMLGFDKPSKTLDWLLTKSRAAIKELMQYSKQNTTTSNSLSSPSPSQGNIGNTNTSDEQKHIINASLMADDSNRAAKVNDPSKESRAKARARARERTREKMSIKHLNNMGASTSNNLRGSAGFRDPIVPHGHGAYEQGGQDLIQESIMIKRKLKNPSFFGFQQNVILSRDLSSNYIVPSANANENNWDICAILDHHKFINSNSNI